MPDFQISDSTIREMVAHREAREQEQREEALVDEIVRYLGDAIPAVARQLVAKELITKVRAAS